MDIRAPVWREKWSDESLEIERIGQLLSTARHNAKANPFPVFDMDTLEEGIRKMRGSSAKGIEQLGKTDLVWLPESGKQELVYLFQQVEQE
eukprot:2631425-Pyramimonas_sp.AAC.1